MKVNCLRCGIGWNREPEEPEGVCPGCGSAWSKEVDLSQKVGARGDYQIVEEREGRGGVTALDLRQVYPFSATATVELNRRLKSAYRKAKGDQRVDDPRDAVIAFGIAPDGDEKGKWIITNFRRRTPQEVLKEQTGGCRRHQLPFELFRNPTT